MAFELLPTIPATMKVDIDGSISYKRNSRAKKRNSPPRLIISVPKLVNGGVFARGDCISLLVGTGPDHGKALLTKRRDDSDGAIAHVVRGGTLLLRFGYVPMLGGDAAERERLELRACAEGFEFDLPPWFKGKV